MATTPEMTGRPYRPAGPRAITSSNGHVKEDTMGRTPAPAEYAVTIDVTVHHPTPPSGLEDALAEVAGDLVDLLADHGAAASVRPHQDDQMLISLTCTHRAASLGAAAAKGSQQGLQAIAQCLATHGLEDATLRQDAVEVLTTDEQDRRLTHPPLPDLVGAQEAADILGVARQRVHQLRQKHPAFPAPVLVLSTGALWTRPSIVAFGASRTYTRSPVRTAAG